MLELPERARLIQKTIREYVQASEAQTVAEGAISVGALIAGAAKSIEENLGTAKAIDMLIAIAKVLAEESPDCAMRVIRTQGAAKGHFDA